MNSHCFVAIALLLLACSTPSQSPVVATIDSTQVSLEANAVMYKDTTIMLKGIIPDGSVPAASIRPEVITEVLKDYFRTLGYYIHGEVPQKVDDGNLVVIYDRHSEAHLNQDGEADAFVFYWLIPPGGTGTCFKPHAAMVVSNGMSYSLVHPDFIESGLNVDSITTAGAVTLFCSATPCSGGTERLAVTLSPEQVKSGVDWINEWEDPKEKDLILSMKWVHPRIKQCLKDPDFLFSTHSFLSDMSSFLSVKNLGDINGDRVNDSIMVVPELVITDEGGNESGKSIIFTDPSIPRIKVDQLCLDVGFVFVVADIDEDGFSELGKYYTSCASRFKRLDLFSLKNGKWKSYGPVTFDVFFEDPPMEDRIKKAGRNKFKMREITDDEGKKIDRWVAFEME